MNKICTKCKTEKLTSEFGTASPNKDGFNSWCKQCVRDAGKRYRQTLRGIYSSMKGRAIYYIEHGKKKQKPFEITMEEFLEWADRQEMMCGYCDLPEEQVWIMNDYFLAKGNRLTVDCMDNPLGYINGNLIWACDKCNSVKNNILNYEQMRYIGQTFIKPIWEAILKKHGEQRK